jgi:hypothetical protein
MSRTGNPYDNTKGKRLHAYAEVERDLFGNVPGAADFLIAQSVGGIRTK